MLYSGIQWLEPFFPGLHVFDIVMVRALVALFTSWAIVMLMAPSIINRMHEAQFNQPIRSDIALSHEHKSNTPTMGGIMILVAVVCSTLLWGDLHDKSMWLAMFVMLSFGGIGALDDYLKLKYASSKGLKASWKYFLQSLFAGVTIWLLYQDGYAQSAVLVFPFMSQVMPHIGLWFIPLAYFVIVGTSNAVNLTDGLDGLAIMPVVLVSLALGIVASIIADSQTAQAFQLPYEPVGELIIFCGALVGGGIGFLWFNAYPAQIFMGDVGALGAGASLGVVSILLHQEILLFLMGGIFVAETLSVILQVASYQMTGRRIFRMAPLHHHFELKGWPEPQITIRFWIATFVLVLLGLISVKLRM